MAEQEGIYVRIPINEVTLEDAYAAVEDVAFWDETMPPILYHFKGIGVADYYRLTVGQHRLLYDFLVGNGVIDADS